LPETTHGYWNKQENLPAWIADLYRDITPSDDERNTFKDPFDVADDESVDL